MVSADEFFNAQLVNSETLNENITAVKSCNNNHSFFCHLCYTQRELSGHFFLGMQADRGPTVLWYHGVNPRLRIHHSS